jgi:hypothetical protein
MRRRPSSPHVYRQPPPVEDSMAWCGCASGATPNERRNVWDGLSAVAQRKDSSWAGPVVSWVFFSRARPHTCDTLTLLNLVY